MAVLNYRHDNQKDSVRASSAAVCQTRAGLWARGRSRRTRAARAQRVTHLLVECALLVVHLTRMARRERRCVGPATTHVRAQAGAAAVVARVRAGVACVRAGVAVLRAPVRRAAATAAVASGCVSAGRGRRV